MNLNALSQIFLAFGLVFVQLRGQVSTKSALVIKAHA